MAKWDHLLNDQLDEGDEDIRKLWRKYASQALPVSGATASGGWADPTADELRYIRALTRTGRYSYPSREAFAHRQVSSEFPVFQASGAPHTLQTLGISFETVSNAETQEILRYSRDRDYARIVDLTGLGAASKLKVGDYIDSVAGTPLYLARIRKMEDLFNQAIQDRADYANTPPAHEKRTKEQLSQFSISAYRPVQRNFPATGQQIHAWAQAQDAERLTFDNYARRLYREIEAKLTKRAPRQSRFSGYGDLSNYRGDAGVTGTFRGPNGVKLRVYMDLLSMNRYDETRPTHEPTNRGYGELHLRLSFGDLEKTTSRWHRTNKKAFTCTGFVELRLSGPLYQMMVVDQTRYIDYDYNTGVRSIVTRSGSQDAYSKKNYSGLVRGGLPSGVWKRHIFRDGDEILDLMLRQTPKLCRPFSQDEPNA